MADGATVKPLLRALALGVGPLVVAGGVGFMANGQLPQRLALPSPASTASCTQPPMFKPGYQQGENYVIPQGDGFKFGGNSWVEANLCSPGIIRITADGEEAGDELPKLTVLQDDEIIANPGFSKLRTVNIKVKHAGRLYLSFLNDYYQAEARVATFRQIDFKADDCKGLKGIVVPKETGGIWDATNKVASLVTNVSMTLEPCNAGRLSLQAIGRRGKMKFPQLIFKQDDKILKILETTSNWQLISLNLSASPLSITLKNPYFATLADRNLNVRRIEFIPSQP